MAVSPHDPEHVFVSGGNSPVVTLASRDGGATWIEREWPWGSHGGRVAFAISSKTPGRVFVHAWGEWTFDEFRFAVSDDWGDTFGITNYREPWGPYLLADTSEALYSGGRGSHDMGQTWEPLSGSGFMDFFADADFGISGRYGEERTGLVVGYDQGTEWHRVERDLPLGPNRISARIDRRDTTVYLATSRGLYAYARPGALATPTEQPDVVPEALRMDAYPNPARGRVTVAYVLPEAGPVRLAVYDLLGREVALLVEGQQVAGRHRAHLEAGAWPAGVYVYRLQAGGTAKTGKLLLVK